MKHTILLLSTLLLGACATTSQSSNTAVSSTAVTKQIASYTYNNNDLDASYDEATATKIALNGNAATITNGEVTQNDNVLTITKAGVYELSGNYNGQIVVNVTNTEKVKLVLNNATITSSNGPAINVVEADKVTITLREGTKNVVADSASYNNAAITEDLSATIFSKGDLVLNGTGELSVTGNYKNAIQSKDDVVIISGTYTLNAVNDGIKGKDSVQIKEANVTINTSGDGIVATNTEDATKGYVAIENGTFQINVTNDAIQSVTKTEVLGGDFNIKTSANTRTGESAKGIKSDGAVNVQGGNMTLSTIDDALHGANVTVSGGTLNISTGDDGLHADSTLTISGGVINVVKSYEGLEGQTIVLSGGEVSVVSSDDAINAAGSNGNGTLKITGGTHTLTSNGDGLDSNGNIEMSGGTVHVFGPTSGGNGSLDFDGTFTLTGGTLIVAGTSSMAQVPNGNTTQTTIATTVTTQQAGSTLQIKDASGNVVASVTPTLAYNYIVVSTPNMKKGETYMFTVNNTTLTSVQTTGVVTSSGVNTNGMPMMGGRR